MTCTTNTQKLHHNIKSAALDLADALLDLACHHAADAPEDRERIDTARVYMHEVAGGDKPREVPHGDILFTVGALLAAVPDQPPGIKELRVALMPALGALLGPAKTPPSTPPTAARANAPYPSSRPPGVPNSTAKPRYFGKFYRVRHHYPESYR